MRPAAHRGLRVVDHDKTKPQPSLQQQARSTVSRSRRANGGSWPVVARVLLGSGGLHLQEGQSWQ